MRKEIRILQEGETVIRTQEVEITLLPHLPLKKPRLSGEELEKLAAFCQKYGGECPPDSLPSHKRVAQAIKKAAAGIYQSYLLTPSEDKDKIRVFSEVWLGSLPIDCLILGPFGAILIEVKRVGSSAEEQLKKHRDFWRKQFPKVPFLTFKASYHGNKVTLR